MKCALISDITSQVGFYLAEFLIDRHYTAHGIVHRPSQFSQTHIEHLRRDGEPLGLHCANPKDQTTFWPLFVKIQPHEFYHLADQSHQGLSFDIPESTVAEPEVTTLSLLKVYRDLPSPPPYFHAASLELSDIPDSFPQSENTPFRPVDPYGSAKAFATKLFRFYREMRGMFVVNGILHNHESPRHGESFVTRKIASSVARIAKGSEGILRLGNLASERVWEYTTKYAKAFWMSLQHTTAEDFVFATATSTCARNCAAAAFEKAGIDLAFQGEGELETAFDTSTGRTLLRVDPRFFRRVDSYQLVGNSSKPRLLVAWKPSTTGSDVAKVLTRTEINGL